ncbi:MAG: mycothione reductase [Propionibacteriaceae bacterium]|jgi:mycothione reductase|nr:mycothione reductase [Propionibacteriaceae bacterium]
MKATAEFDVVVIGAGSGNALVGGGFPGQSVALIDEGVPFGGTCLNKGCIPSKMLAHVGAVAHLIGQAPRLGLRQAPPEVDWPAVQRRVWQRIDPIAAAGQASRAEAEGIELIRGHARFVDPHLVSVDLLDGGQRQVSGRSFVIATGSRPVIPDLAGLDHPAVAARIHTSDDVMRLDRLPRSLAVMGGGVVACEFADLFANLGVDVTVVQRSSRLLRRADREVSQLLTDDFASRMRLRLNQTLTEVQPAADGLDLYAVDADGIEYHYDAEALLLAVGRRPNSDDLGLERAGVVVRDNGQVQVDSHLRTSVPHIWALGDVDSPELLKHVANREARVVRHNLEHPKDLVELDARPIPWTLFSSPQVAGCGATEQALEQAGRSYRVGRQDFRDVAYGWAMAETSPYFAKVLADPDSGQILGAHIIGPEAALLLQPLVQAMTFGLDAGAMARDQYWPHPGLQEVVENALLKLDLTGPNPAGRRASGRGLARRWGKARG